MHFRNLEDQHQTIHQNYEDFGHRWITLCSDHICWLDIVSLIHPRNFYPSQKSKLKLRLYVRSEDRIKIMYISKIVKPILLLSCFQSKQDFKCKNLPDYLERDGLTSGSLWSGYQGQANFKMHSGISKPYTKIWIWGEGFFTL